MGTERDAPSEPSSDFEPRPPQGIARRLLLLFPIALFLFLMGVLIWGILDDLLAGY